MEQQRPDVMLNSQDETDIVTEMGSKLGVASRPEGIHGDG